MRGREKVREKGEGESEGGREGVREGEREKLPNTIYIWRRTLSIYYKVHSP